MRLILAAAFTALALPAHAQRVDTRRIEIREMPSSTMCSFNAYRDLTLIDGAKGGHGKVATWRKAPEGSPLGERARLELVFEPAEAGEGKWRRPPILGLAFHAYADDTLTRDAIGGARLSIDGESPVELQYNASRDKFTFAVALDTEEVAHRLIKFGRKTAEVEIYDRQGTTIRRYTIDIDRLIDAVEIVSIVGWSCTSP